MDVRCERCKTEYELNDDQVTEAGVPVKCTVCSHVFRVKRRAMTVTVPFKLGENTDQAAVLSPSQFASAAHSANPERPREWRIRSPEGTVSLLRELTTLQRWIVERKVSRDEEISATGETWKRLGDIPELQSFFQVVEDAQIGQDLMRKQVRAEPPSAPPSPSGPRHSPAAGMPASTPSTSPAMTPVVSPMVPLPAMSGGWGTVASGDMPFPRAPSGEHPSIPPFAHAAPTFAVPPASIAGAGPSAGPATRSAVNSSSSSATSHGNGASASKPALRSAERKADADFAPGVELDFHRRGRRTTVRVLLGLLLLAGAAAAYVYQPWNKAEPLTVVRDPAPAPVSPPAPGPATASEDSGLPSTASPAPAVGTHPPAIAPAGGSEATPVPSALQPSNVPPGPAPKGAPSAASRLMAGTGAKGGTASVPGAPSSALSSALSNAALNPAATPSASVPVAPAPNVAPNATEPAPAAAPAPAATELVSTPPAAPVSEAPPQTAPITAAPAQAPAVLRPAAGAASRGPSKALTEALETASAAPTPVAAPAATPPKREPRDFDHFMAMGDRLRERERTDAAMDAYSKAVDLAPERAEGYAGRGLALMDLGRSAQAEASFQQALRLNPRYGVALMGMAEASRAQGKKEEAIRYYEKYLDAIPNGSESTAAQAAIQKLSSQ